MKWMEYPFTWLVRKLFALRQRMKYFLLRACVRTSEFKISWRHLAHYVQEMYVHACSTCRALISPDSTNHMTHLRCCSRRRFVHLSIFKRSLTRVHIVLIVPNNPWLTSICRTSSLFAPPARPVVANFSLNREISSLKSWMIFVFSIYEFKTFHQQVQLRHNYNLH